MNGQDEEHMQSIGNNGSIKKIKTKYRMLKALGIEPWKAKELANGRKGYWRMAQVLNSVITNKIIAS